MTVPTAPPGFAHYITKEVLHISDARAEQRMRGWIVELAGARTLLLVPMLKDNKFVGALMCGARGCAPAPSFQPAGNALEWMTDVRPKHGVAPHCFSICLRHVMERDYDLAAALPLHGLESCDRRPDAGACARVPAPTKAAKTPSNSVKGTSLTSAYALSLFAGSSRGLNATVSSIWFPTRFGTCPNGASPCADRSRLFRRAGTVGH
jgi:hypothetical protein